MTTTSAAAASARQLFGLNMNALTMTQVLEVCDDALRTRVPLTIGVVNAAKIVNIRGNAVLRDSLLECDLILADGQSVVWASKVLRHPLPERVAGIDLFEQLLGKASDEHRRVYFLGARSDVLELMRQQVLERFPGLTIAGMRDGYFTDAESEQVAKEIAAAGADMLFLGITSPKKEIFLGRFGSVLATPVQHGVGGSFDILAGVTKRAPERWQRSGFEWLYRLRQEPRRLWRRYARTNTAFVALTVKEMFRPSPGYQHTDRG
jgi:N-acetylglucosaminyldiphosphoundecaprenol N-acetyl-beta-D-mannosaminyltransferase